jgi:hypothetical protein
VGAQDKFKAGVAAAVLVDPANVVINNVTAAPAATDRRLLSTTATGVVVDFSIITPATVGVDKATPMARALADVGAINTALAQQGVAAISEVVSAPVTVSSAGATTGASPRATSLHPTRDFSPYSQCAESRSWPGARPLLRNGAAFAGGLGALMTTEHQSYMCFKGHACLADVGASALDHMCYLYSEVDHTFRPWGFNSELRLLW